MSIHQDRGAFVVRWREDRQQRSKRFKTRAGAEAFQDSIGELSKPPVRRLSLGAFQDLAAEVARRTAPVFAGAGWTWRDVGIPDEAQIAACIMGLMESAREDTTTEVRTGRFSVSCFVEEGEDVEQCAVSLQVGRREAADREAA